MNNKKEKSKDELIREEIEKRLGYKLPEFEVPEIKKLKKSIERLRMMRFA